MANFRLIMLSKYPVKIRKRFLSAIFVDAVMLGASWFSAFLLRFNFDIPQVFQKVFLYTVIPVVLVQLLVLGTMGAYASLWRYISVPDLRRLVISTAFSTCLILLALKFGWPGMAVPRSVWVIHIMLVWVMLGGLRMLARMQYEHASAFGNSKTQKSVLIIGAGNAGLSLAKDLQKSSEWKVVGFLDDDALKVGRRLYGCKILGTVQNLAVVCQANQIQQVILALPSASYAQKSKILRLCRSIEGLQVMTVPAIQDIMSGAIPLAQIKQLDIEDLLGREPVQLDFDSLKDFLKGKVVMVTGAGGSIGSELCRQLLKFSPAKLVFFEKSEPALYNLEQEFAQIDGVNRDGIPFSTLVGDVTDRSRIRWVIQNHKPDVVFHAAAYKHVPLMEEDNAWEAIRNNSWGSHLVASECAAWGVEKFILISTDKAVRPCNVMGASKRLAERLVQGIAISTKAKTRFITVRFGNVLGSQGSVIPKFRKQLLHGGPLTVTHPDMERFFMSIPEASQLVIQAAAMGEGGEIFVLEMGTPVKLVALAKDMIRLSGLPEGEVEIKFTGLRPGEKLYEELFGEGEAEVPTGHAKIRVANSSVVTPEAYAAILKFVSEPEFQVDGVVRAGIKDLLADYVMHAR